MFSPPTRNYWSCFTSVLATLEIEIKYNVTQCKTYTVYSSWETRPQIQNTDQAISTQERDSVRPNHVRDGGGRCDGIENVVTPT